MNNPQTKRICWPFFHRWFFKRTYGYTYQQFECSKCGKLKLVGM